MGTSPSLPHMVGIGRPDLTPVVGAAHEAAML
jgi:hypothetical protein